MVDVSDSSSQPKHKAPVLGNIKYCSDDVHNTAMICFIPLCIFVFGEVSVFFMC